MWDLGLGSGSGLVLDSESVWDSESASDLGLASDLGSASGLVSDWNCVGDFIRKIAFHTTGIEGGNGEEVGLPFDEIGDRGGRGAGFDVVTVGVRSRCRSRVDTQRYRTRHCGPTEA